jgi:phage/plasmid-like protein (TIGR03299 family)
MKMPSSLQIGGVDAIDMYLMAWNTHDGTSSFNLMTTPIRVVCQNTLSMAINNAKSSFALRHTTNVQGKVQEAREALQLSWKYTEAFTAEAEELLAQKLSTNDFAKIVEKLIPIDESVDRKRTLSEEARGALMGLWNAPTQQNVFGTKWAAWNAVVEYADWAKPVRGDNADVKRAERIVTGAGDAFKNKALTLIK